MLAGVKSLTPGDAIMGIAPGCLGPAVHVPADLIVRKPPALSFQDACTAPTVFCTVHAAFNDCIGLRPGSKVCNTRQHVFMIMQSSLHALPSIVVQSPSVRNKAERSATAQPASCRIDLCITALYSSFAICNGRQPLLLQVLVHAGTGGVGLAAVSLAGALGCAVCTTAGSSVKRAFLRASGVREVVSSRDASFSDEFLCSPSAGALLLIFKYVQPCSGVLEPVVCHDKWRLAGPAMPCSGCRQEVLTLSASCRRRAFRSGSELADVARHGGRDAELPGARRAAGGDQQARHLEPGARGPGAPRPALPARRHRLPARRGEHLVSQASTLKWRIPLVALLWSLALFAIHQRLHHIEQWICCGEEPALPLAWSFEHQIHKHPLCPINLPRNRACRSCSAVICAHVRCWRGGRCLRCRAWRTLSARRLRRCANLHTHATSARSCCTFRSRKLCLAGPQVRRR